MAESKVSSRYAKSLLDLAIEQKSLDQVRDDISLFHATLNEHSQLRAVLSSPVIDGDDKKAILHKLFDGKVNQLTLAFFDIMLPNGRARLFNDASSAFG